MPVHPPCRPRDVAAVPPESHDTFAHDASGLGEAAGVAHGLRTGRAGHTCGMPACRLVWRHVADSRRTARLAVSELATGLAGPPRAPCVIGMLWERWGRVDVREACVD